MKLPLGAEWDWGWVVTRGWGTLTLVWKFLQDYIMLLNNQPNEICEPWLGKFSYRYKSYIVSNWGSLDRYIRYYCGYVGCSCLQQLLTEVFRGKVSRSLQFSNGKKWRKERRNEGREGGRKAADRRRWNGNIRGGERERKTQMWKQNDKIGMLIIGESRWKVYGCWMYYSSSFVAGLKMRERDHDFSWKGSISPLNSYDT